MAFDPAILVTSSDAAAEILLVVGTQIGAQTLEPAVRELKSYMSGVGASVGLFVVPERLWIYRDRYLPILPAEKSIIEVGNYDVSGLLGFRHSGNNARDLVAFENVVQSWLEGLSKEANLRRLPLDLRRTMEQDVVPELERGVVRSGHPRERISA